MIKPFFKTETFEKKKAYRKFVIEPLQQGFGDTVGNALRRVLLNNLEGAAIADAQIQGVRHPFSTISGMKEDVVEFILNLKQIRIDYNGDKDVKLKLNVSGPKEITAANIQAPANVKIINKDLKLATLADKKSKLRAEMTVRLGVGYSPAEERPSSTIGIIPIDAIFSPVTRVNYKVEATRVGRRTDFDKLILEVWTDGTTDPKVALEKAAKTLVNFFKQVYKPVFEAKEKDTSHLQPENYELLSLTLEELSLPTRIVNALRHGGYEKVSDLVGEKVEKISQVKNLGKKSIEIVRKKLKDKGVHFIDEA